MKKVISCFLVVAIFLSLFTMVTFAESDPPNIVADYHFTTSTQGWYVFNGSSLIHQEGYIGASNNGKSWVSPAKDIYDVIKEEGAGTYVINARIFIAFDPGHEVNARMMLRTDKEYSFSTNHNGNYYGDIGTLTYCEPHTWTNISGSVKILESDIQGASGDFILCFDSLFDLETYNVYVDDVTVCKLYEDDITNGDFSYHEVGWRNWGGKGNFTVEYGFDGILGSIFKAYYLKASPYGSIVTNVDQIIAKYGCTKYKLKFKIKVEEDYLENLEKIGFLFARNKGDYNYWIGMADATTLEDGNWVTFEKTVDMATIIQDGQTLYDVLAPYQNQVFLRYHYFDADGVSYDEEHSYYITDVSFKPVPQIDSIQLSETNKTVERGWTGKIGCTISGNVEANGYIRWTSSDPNIIEIDSETGRMVAKSVGNTNIFAISKENLVVYSVCNITVQECKQAVILIHGRTDNTASVFGIANAVSRDFVNDSNNNSHYNSSVDAISLNGKKYTDIDTQKIQSYTINGITVNSVFNGTYNLNGHIDHDGTELEGNLAFYLVNEKGYTPNKNLFAFNYPNEDAVIHNAMKFKVYIDNLINYVRSSNNEALKAAFYLTESDYDANNYRFSIVGHSMGGLVARYYIENCTELTHYETGEHNTTCKYGDLHVSKLITIDTPHWGSDLADVSSVWGIKHELCDHDLEVESAMFGGNIGDKITCKAIFDKCDAQNYKVTDELNYDRYRHTKYYAIAGIDYNATFVNNNNQKVEILEDITTYEELEKYVHSKTDYMMYESNVNSVVGTINYMSLSTVGDNVVDFYSQIGWYGETTAGSPLKKVNMYKIFINIDSDGSDFTNNLISHFHGKMPHRTIVIEKISEYLGENVW